MANVFQKAQRLVATSLGLLVRDSVLSQLVWRDAAGDFAGAKNDTITIRMPAYAKANKRGLRSGDTRNDSELVERGVAITLTDNLYLKVPVTDAELTLDVESFAAQVIAPIMGGMRRGLEDEVLTLVAGASYHANHQIEWDEAKPLETATTARRLLNDARVPMEDRILAVGSGADELLVNALTPADEAGGTGALRDAVIGRLRGFTVVTVPGLPPDKAVAYHRSAFVLSSRAPAVPDGAPAGAVSTFDGYAIRLVQAIDPDEVINKVHADVFTGTNVVTDEGHFDDNGQWIPSVDPEDSGEGEEFVRAVEITLPS